MTLDLTLTEAEALSGMDRYKEIQVVSPPLNPMGRGDYNFSKAALFLTNYYLKIDDLPEPVVQLHQEIERTVDFAFENSYVHGGNVIHARLRYTPQSILVTIEDDGPGFDAAETVAKFLRGEKYYTFGGAGFDCFHTSPARVSFERTKTIIFHER